MREYLAIEGYRFGSRLETHIAVSPDAEAATVPGFILQPLAENAIRHGLETTEGICRIVIRADVVKEHLQLAVSNTGKWRSPGAGGGIGLDNVRSRLRLLYGDRATLTIGQREDSVCITLLIPR